MFAPCSSVFELIWWVCSKYYRLLSAELPAGQYCKGVRFDNGIHCLHQSVDYIPVLVDELTQLYQQSRSFEELPAEPVRKFKKRKQVQLEEFMHPADIPPVRNQLNPPKRKTL